ncbi:MAG TPA: hypothetical protein ENK91_14310, partial [Bacteroidetes bacterium]|nr:hypothetical protein [Bacteroidota bacterium]
GFGAVSMTIDNYDQLWLGTNKGLYIVHDISDFDIYNNNIFSYAQYVNLPDNDKSYVFSIKKVKNKLVVANAKSINIIPLRKYPLNLKNVEINQLKYGFDINGEMTEQNAIYFDEAEYLWVGVRSGILRIDFDMLRMDTTDVELKFDYIKNGGLDLKLNDNSIRLDPLRRNLHIAISPERNKYLKNNILYEYILTNKGGDTILNHGRTLIKSIETGYLNPGNYNLKLIAYKNGKEKDKKELNIIVPYTFLENPLTLPLGISFSLFAISMILFYRKEQNKKMARKNLFLEKIKNEKEQLKVQAILNNFNPHFINNSLNWVQARYYEDQDMTKMIGRLSENINYIFNKTQKTQTFHSLKEEFHLINNYIEIQKLRFGQDNINLQKPEDDDILHKIDVIVMQVLIHVENAVEHGLRNRAGSNQIIIKINEDEKYYYIVIIDDGAGRKRAKEIGSKGLQSGLNMLKSIYSIYNANPNNRYKIKTQYIDDIFTYRNEKFGTKVILSIPKEYIFDINF